MQELDWMRILIYSIFLYFEGKLKQLEKIDVSYNELEEVPSELGDCRLVTLLDLQYNKITSLPESLGKIFSMLCGVINAMVIIYFSKIYLIFCDYSFPFHLFKNNWSNTYVCDSMPNCSTSTSFWCEI